METVCFCETLVSTCKSTRRYNPGDQHLTNTQSRLAELRNRRWMMSTFLTSSVTAFFGHCPSSIFNKITTFRKLDLLPSSGKKGGEQKP
jgi:hypothetical protein